MLELCTFREFREGLALLRDGEAEKALPLLRQAAERDPENPYYVSYYGLSLAAAERKWGEAERLCHTAVCRGRRQAQLYLNLAEVYIAADRRQAAADTLARGLRYLPRDFRLYAELGKISIRRAAILRFLPRTHLLNRGFGRLRHVILGYIPRRKWLTVRESRA